MDFKQLQKKALELREKYAQLEKRKYGREWSREEIFLGLVGDIGELSQLIQSNEGIRDNIDKKKIGHELADCLWSILVLADKYGVDIEKELIELASND